MGEPCPAKVLAGHCTALGSWAYAEDLNPISTSSMCCSGVPAILGVAAQLVSDNLFRMHMGTSPRVAQRLAYRSHPCCRAARRF